MTISDRFTKAAVITAVFLSICLLAGAVLATLAEWFIWLLVIVTWICGAIIGSCVIGMVLSVLIYRWMNRHA